jgi:hypothetical protein
MEERTGVELGVHMTAQLQGPLAAFDAAPPPPLPHAPAMAHYVLESPWLLSIAMIALAVIGATLLSTRGRPRSSRIAAVAGVTAAVVMISLAGVIETPREVMARRAQQLISSTAAGDAGAVEAMLTPDAVLYLPPSPVRHDHRAIVERVRTHFSSGGVWAVSSCRVVAIQACEDAPGRGRVQVKVAATPAGMGGTFPSWWRIDFERGSDEEWRVSGISLLSLPQGMTLQ